MTTVATLDTLMRLDSTAFRQGMIGAAAQANKSLGAIQKQATETASVLLQLKRAAGAAGSLYLVKEGFNSLVESQKQLQAISYTFQAATGSASKAADALSFVRKEAQDIGLVLPDSAEGFAKLSASATAAGVAMSDQTQLFDAYAKASTTLHLSTTQSNRALLALEQMFAKGKIQAQELRLQLGQAIPGAAARFQNAVLQMTKGTDLAGKSFDQLLEAGDLTTSKFLPALVQALQQSGQGWESASHGLQAELNRVQTAWFNLKSEVSGGLFNDSVTAGARLLADNLGMVANAVTAIGAGTLARVLGGTLRSGAGRAQQVAQEYRGTQMAAAAEREYAQSILAKAQASTRAAEAAALENQVVKDSAALSLSNAKAREIEAFGIKEVALAEMQRLESAAALNEALATGAAAKRAQAEIDARLATTSKALLIAEQQMSAAIVEQTAAREALTRVEGQQAALRATVARAVEAEAAAEAAAQAALTTERAVGGLAAAAGRAAKSFGAFALSLVGGPWGAAVLAIGGVAYAVYSAQKASEEYRAETAQQVQSLQALRDSVKAAADEYGRLGSRMTLSQAQDSLTGAQGDLKKKRDELEALRLEAQHLQAVLAANPGNTQNSIANAFSERKLANVIDRIKELEAELVPTTTAVDGLSLQLRGALTPAVDGLRAAIEAVRNGGGLGDFIKNLASADDVAAGVKDVEHAQQLANSALAAMTSLGDKARKDILTKGKSRVDQLDAELAVTVSNIKAQRLDAEKEAAALAAAQKEYDKQRPDARKADIADSAKKNASAINQEAEAYKNFTATQRGQIDTLQAQIDGTAKGSAAQRALNQMLAGGTAEFRKLTPAHQAEVLASQRHIAALTDEAEKLQLAAAAAKQLADLDRQLAEQRAQQDRENARSLEGMGHGSVWNEQAKGIEQIQDAYRRQREEADKTYQSAVSQATATGNLANVQAQLDETHAQALGKIALTEQEAILAQRQYYAEQKSMQDDWQAGVRAAYEDYADQAGNAYQQARDVANNAFQSMEDSLVSFATTGKLNFKSMVVSILKDLARMEIRIAASRILMSFFGGGGTTSVGTGAGDALNGGSNYTGSGSLSTSWPGRATGGSVGAGQMYQVAENNRPELLTSGGRTYLMMGSSGGSVTPASSGSSSSGGGAVGDVKVSVTIVQSGDGGTDTKANVDAATALGRQLGEQMKSTATQVVLRALQPNGIIDRKLKARA